MVVLSSRSSSSKNTMAALSPRSHLFLVLFCAAYLASRAAALSRNCSSDYPALSDTRHDRCLTVNTTVAIYCVLAADFSFGRALPHGTDTCPSVVHRGSITPPYGGGGHFNGISATGVLEDDLMVGPPPPCWEKHRARHLPVHLESSKEKNTGTYTVRLVGRSPPALHCPCSITTGLLSSDCSASVLENKTGVRRCNISASLSFLIIVVESQEEQSLLKTGENRFSASEAICRETLTLHQGLFFLVLLFPMLVKLNTTAIYYVPAAGCPDICLSAEHRGSITPPYGGGDHFIGISATGVPEDDLTVEPPPPCWEKHRARHLPVDLESSKEKNTGTNTVRLVGRSPPALHFITTGLLSSDCSALVLENKTGVLCCSNSANLSFVIHGIAFSSRGGTGTGSPSIRRLLSGAYSRSAAKQHVAIHGKVASWSWKEKASVVGALAAASVLLGLLLCCIRKNRRGRSTAAIELEEDDDQSVLKPDLWRGLGPRQFRYSELVAATCNFAEERKLGRGGFGPVYRGYLSDQDRNVAIKVLSREQSEQGIKEFQAEVAVMSQLRHRHIVQLVGWCDSRTGLLLVYELMAGGSLDTQLYSPERLLTWSERYKIALGLGSALLYLHTDCDQCVVHGDIKPANVMLDALRNAKLGDFGLARLVDHGTELPTTQIVAGTVGYIDPEFVNNRRPRAESDVYSFGVVLLEIASGRRPASAQSNGASALLAWARGMYDRNMILDAADRRLNGEFDETQMERVLVTGLWCAHHDPSQRPSIAQAMDVLRSEDATLPVLLAMSGAEQIRSLEERAYGDLSAEGSASAHASTATPYLTCKYSTYLLAEE